MAKPETVKMKILRNCFLPEGMTGANPDPKRNPRKMLEGEIHEVPADHAKFLDDKGFAKLVWK